MGPNRQRSQRQTRSYETRRAANSFMKIARLNKDEISKVYWDWPSGGGARKRKKENWVGGSGRRDLS